MFLDSINDYLVNYGNYAVWLPTILVGLVILTRVLKGMRRGFRKSFILMINGIIALAVAVGLYYFVFLTPEFNVKFVDLINQVLDMSGQKSLQDLASVSNTNKGITDIFSAFMYNSVIKDYGTYEATAPLYSDLIAYSTAWAVTLTKLIFLLVMFIVYIVIKFVLYILYLIFLKEGRRKRRINAKHKINHGPEYRKHAFGGGVIGLVRGVVWGLVLLSFIGSFGYIVTGGNYSENNVVAPEDDLGITFGTVDNGAGNNVKFSYIYNIFQKYGTTGVGQIAESVKNESDIPYYLLIADALTKTKVGIFYDDGVAEYSPEAEVTFREMFGPLGYVVFSSAVTFSEYGFDTTKINDNDYLANFFANDELQSKMNDYIDQINHTEYWDSFVKAGIDSAVNLYVNQSDTQSGTSYFETLFTGENAITPSDILNKDDYNLIYKVVFKSLGMYEPASRLSGTDDINEQVSILNDSVEDITSIINDLFELNIFKEGTVGNITANKICVPLINSILTNLEPTFSTTNVSDYLTDSSEVNYLLELKNINNIISPSLQIANSLAVDGILSNTDDPIALLSCFNESNRSAFDTISTTIGNSELLGYFLNAQGVEDFLNKSVSNNEMFYKGDNTYIIPEGISWSNTIDDDGNIVKGEVTKTIDSLFSLTEALNKADFDSATYSTLTDSEASIDEKTTAINRFSEALNSKNESGDTVLSEITESAFVHNILSDTLLGIKISMGDVDIQIVVTDVNIETVEINQAKDTKELIKSSELATCLESLTTATTLLAGYDGEDYSTIINNIQDNEGVISTLLESEILRNAFSIIMFNQLNNLDIENVNISIPSDFDLSDVDSDNFNDNLLNWSGAMDQAGNVTTQGEISNIFDIITETDLINTFFDTTDGASTSDMINGILDATSNPSNVETILGSDLINVILTSTLTSPDLIGDSGYEIVIPGSSLIDNKALDNIQVNEARRANNDSVYLASNVSTNTIEYFKMLDIEAAKKLFSGLSNIINNDTGTIRFDISRLTDTSISGIQFRSELAESEILSATIANAIVSITSDPALGEISSVFTFPSDYIDMESIGNTRTGYSESPWFKLGEEDGATSDFSKLLDSLITLKLDFDTDLDGNVTPSIDGNDSIDTTAILDTVFNLESNDIVSLFECNLLNYSLTGYLTKDDLFEADGTFTIVIPDSALSQLAVKTAGEDESFIEPSSNFAKLDLTEADNLFTGIKPLINESGELEEISTFFDLTSADIDLILSSGILEATMISTINTLAGDDGSLNGTISLPSYLVVDNDTLKITYPTTGWIKDGNHEIKSMLLGVKEVEFDYNNPTAFDTSVVTTLNDTSITDPSSLKSKLDVMLESGILQTTLSNKIASALTVPFEVFDTTDFILSDNTITYVELQDIVTAVIALDLDLTAPESFSFAIIKDLNTTPATETVKKINTVLQSKILWSSFSQTIIDTPELNSSGVKEVNILGNDYDTGTKFIEKNELENLVAAVAELDVTDFNDIDASMINTLNNKSSDLERNDDADKLSVIMASDIMHYTLSDKLTEQIDAIPDIVIPAASYMDDYPTIVKSTEIKSMIYGIFQLGINDFTNIDISISSLSGLTDVYTQSSTVPADLTSVDNANAFRTKIEVIYDSLILSNTIYTKTVEVEEVYVPSYTVDDNNGTEFIKLTEMTRLLATLGDSSTEYGLGLDLDNVDNLDLQSLIGTQDARFKLLRSEILEATVVKIINENIGSLELQEGYKFVNTIGEDTTYDELNLANWISIRDEDGEITAGRELVRILTSVNAIGVDPSDTSGIDANLVLDKTSVELNSILSSDIVYKAVSDNIQLLDNGIVLSIPDVTIISNADFELKEDSFVAIEKNEVINLVLGVKALDIVDVNTLSLNTIDFVGLSSKVDSITASNILWYRLSELIVSNENLYTMQTAKEPQAGQDFITNEELKQLFDGLDLLGITNISDVSSLSIGSSLSEANVDSTLRSIIIEGTMVIKAYENLGLLTKQDGLMLDSDTDKENNMVNWVYGRDELDLYNTSSFEFKEFRNIIASINSLQLSLSGSVAVPDISTIFKGDTESKNDYFSRLDTIISSDIIYNSLSNTISTSINVPSETPYDNSDFAVKEVGYEAIDKDEIKDLLFGLDSLGLNDLTSGTENAISNIQLSNIEAENIVPSWILWYQLSTNIGSNLEITNSIKAVSYDGILIDPLNRYVVESEINNFVTALSELGINDFANTSGDVLSGIDLTSVSASDPLKTKIEVVLESYILWYEVSETILATDFVVPTNHNSTTINDINSVYYKVSDDEIYIQPYEIEAFMSANNGNTTSTSFTDINTLEANIDSLTDSIIIRATITKTLADANPNFIVFSNYFDALASDELDELLGNPGENSTNFIGGTYNRTLTKEELTELVKGLKTLDVDNVNSISFDIDKIKSLTDTQLRNLYLKESDTTDASSIVTYLIFSTVSDIVDAVPYIDNSLSDYYSEDTRTLDYTLSDNKDIYTEDQLIEHVRVLRASESIGALYASQLAMESTNIDSVFTNPIAALNTAINIKSIEVAGYAEPSKTAAEGLLADATNEMTTEETEKQNAIDAYNTVVAQVQAAIAFAKGESEYDVNDYTTYQTTVDTASNDFTNAVSYVVTNNPLTIISVNSISE